MEDQNFQWSTISLLCIVGKKRGGGGAERQGKYFLSRPRQKGEADPLGPPRFSFFPLLEGEEGGQESPTGKSSQVHWAWCFFGLVFSSFFWGGGVRKSRPLVSTKKPELCLG